MRNRFQLDCEGNRTLAWRGGAWLASLQMSATPALVPETATSAAEQARPAEHDEEEEYGGWSRPTTVEKHPLPIEPEPVEPEPVREPHPWDKGEGPQMVIHIVAVRGIGTMHLEQWLSRWPGFVNAPDEHGNTLLHEAVHQSPRSIMSYDVRRSKPRPARPATA